MAIQPLTPMPAPPLPDSTRRKYSTLMPVPLWRLR